MYGGVCNMYYEFIDLKDAPLSVKEVAENIHIVINRHILEQIDRIDCKEIVDSFINAEKIKVAVLTMESEDKDVLLLFQMAVYRFCTVHIPVLLKEVENKLKELKADKSEYEGFLDPKSAKVNRRDYTRSFTESADIDIEERQGREIAEVLLLPWLPEENFREWEIEFWRKGPYIGRKIGHGSGSINIETMNSYRKILRRIKIAEKDSVRSDASMTVREVIELAFQDKGTIEKVEELQQYYKPLKTKAKKLNTMLKNDGMKDELEKIRNMTNIVDRGIHGELTAADIMELEGNIQLWHEGLQSLMNFFN